MDKDLSACQLVVHTVQMLPDVAYCEAGVKRRSNWSPSQEIVISIPVYPGITIELDLARDWTALGSPSMIVSIDFRGIMVTPSTSMMLLGGVGAREQLSSNTRDKFILPSAKLSTWNTPIKPIAEGLFSPCDKCDVLIMGNTQIYQLVLTYQFVQKTSSSITPRAPALQGYLYESGFESQMMLVFDKDKRYLGAMESWLDEVSVARGKASIRLQIRHEDVIKLKKLKDLSIWIKRK